MSLACAGEPADCLPDNIVIEGQRHDVAMIGRGMQVEALASNLERRCEEPPARCGAIKLIDEVETLRETLGRLDTDDAPFFDERQ